MVRTGFLLAFFLLLSACDPLDIIPIIDFHKWLSPL